MNEHDNVPPTSNTGVQSTIGEGLRACVDWAQGTLFNIDVNEFIRDVMALNPEDFTE